jgi:hypothetical protein
VPFVKPLTTQFVAGTVMSQNFELSSTAVTLYESGVPPVPLSVTVTVACWLPATAVGVFGVAGIGATTVKVKVRVERTMMSPAPPVAVSSSAISVTLYVCAGAGIVPENRHPDASVEIVMPDGNPLALQFLKPPLVPGQFTVATGSDPPVR